MQVDCNGCEYLLSNQLEALIGPGQQVVRHLVGRLSSFDPEIISEAQVNATRRVLCPRDGTTGGSFGVGCPPPKAKRGSWVRHPNPEAHQLSLQKQVLEVCGC